MLTLYFTDLDDHKLTEIFVKERINNLDLRIIYRGDGYKLNNIKLDNILDGSTILTNDETLLNNSRFWNEDSKTYNIFKLSKNGEWKPLSDYAYSNLRKANDLTKIFWRGIFDESEEDQNEYL